jgi:YD repeat-containing protein
MRNTKSIKKKFLLAILMSFSVGTMGASRYSSCPAEHHSQNVAGEFERTFEVNPFSTDTITYTYDSLNRLISVTYADGSSITYTYDAAGNRIARQVNGASASINTAVGSNVSVAGNGVIARFATVTGGGATSIAPINPGSVSGLPNGFQLFADSSAFNISTTAVTQGPINVCFNGYFNVDPITFSRLRLVHNENGVWVNRTASSDFAGGLICSSVSSAGLFAMVLLGPPTALVDSISSRAAAMNSVTLLRDPVTVIDTRNFSSDQRTRLAFFVQSIDLLPAESPALVTAQAQDSQNVVYPLTVESVVRVPNTDWLTEVIVKLPDSLIGKGDVQVSVTVRGIKSEKVVIRVQ